jgi:hypothetical protein
MSGIIIDGDNNMQKQWYINDVEYTEQDYKLEMRSRKLKQLL